jgi:hypothetical protein
MRYLSQTAAEVVDSAERLRGAYRRRQFRKKADAAAIDAISDPRTAATVMLVALASVDGPLSPEAEEKIKGSMRCLMGVDNPDEDLIFAKWAAADVADLNSLASRLSRVWNARLSAAERRDLYDLAAEVAALEGPPDATAASALRHLENRLGLVRAPGFAARG